MTHYLAQVNIARMVESLESPVMKGFVDNLDRINSLAEKSEGFVWRLKGDDDNALAIKVFEDDKLIINMSVWRDIESLFNFTYKSKHLEVFRRRKEWFSKLDSNHMVLWYVPRGHNPDPDEAKNKLKYLDKNGPTPYAFNFRTRFSLKDFIEL